MAIVFDCPHCKTNYKLKDDVGGKTATCKNPSCRKVIHIPMPKAPVAVAAPADLDAFAAAAFGEDQAAKPVAEEMISVTCAGCDHTWLVEASKEGKNVLCPECRKPNRVPLRKKAEKADWRSGGGGPTMAKRETGLDVQGAFGTNMAGGIGDETARAIVKDREAQEEPEERRKRRLKIAGYVTLGLAVAGAAVFFGLRTRSEIRDDGRMEDAVAEVEKDGPKDPKYLALIHRAAGEHGMRTAETTKAADEALNHFVKARNAYGQQSAPGTDRNAILAEIAVSQADTLATEEEYKDDKKSEPKKVIPHLRQTLQRISPTEPELLADVTRALTRKFAEKGQIPALESMIGQLPPNGPELLGQMGLELLRLDKEKHRATAEKLLKSPGADTVTSLIAVRIALGVPPPKPDPKAKKEAPADPLRAEVEGEVLKGNVAGARAAARKARPDDRPWALAAGGMAALESNPTEAAEMLTEAAAIMMEKNKTPANWIAIRVCRGLGKLGKFDEADKLASSLTDEQAKAWAKLEVVRGRMANAKGAKADDSWLDVGDPAKVAAAIKVREEVARHNRANGQDYKKTVEGWTKGSVRPFGMAGTVLGRE